MFMAFSKMVYSILTQVKYISFIYEFDYFHPVVHM